MRIATLVLGMLLCGGLPTAALAEKAGEKPARADLQGSPPGEIAAAETQPGEAPEVPTAEAAAPSSAPESAPGSAEPEETSQADATDAVPSSAAEAAGDPASASAEASSETALEELAASLAGDGQEATGGPAPEAGAESAAEPGGSELGPIGYDAEGQPGRIHVVRRGDTLWDISEAYLGTPWVWPAIWEDNPDVANPHRIYPGDRIWITPTEMRRVSAEEAEQLLANQPLPTAFEPEPLPAALDETPIQRAASRTFHWSGREAVGLVSTEELDAAASIVDSPTPVIWFSQGSEVYVGLGEGEVRPGDQFSVVRAVTPVKDLATGQPIGVYVEKLGWLEIDQVFAESSLAIVRASLAEMRRGDKLLPREVPNEEIPVQPASTEIEGHVVYTPASRTVMAETDLVFLDRGRDHGLDVGSQLEVYRPGHLGYDNVRHAHVQLPDHVVAQLIVVSAQPETAVAVVTDAETEIGRGDRFRGSAGTEPQ